MCHKNMHAEYFLTPNMIKLHWKVGGRKLEERETGRELNPHVEKEILLYIIYFVPITSFKIHKVLVQ